MLLAIRHITILDYAAPVCAAIQYLRLRPRSDGGQKVVRWRIQVAGRLSAWQDCHGNDVDTLVIDSPTARVEVIAEGEVDTSITPRSTDVGMASDVYLRTSTLTAVDADLAAFAKSQMPAGLDALAVAVHSAILSRTKEDEIMATAAQAFAEGCGTSIDLAHVFIACCRSCGVPARYVSGYIDSPTGATIHAWAEALTADGWIGYDPALGARVGLGHVVLAIGLDHDDTGIAIGPHRIGGTDQVTMGVRVGQIQQ